MIVFVTSEEREQGSRVQGFVVQLAPKTLVFGDGDIGWHVEHLDTDMHTPVDPRVTRPHHDSAGHV
jgi:hypothetical protein